MSVDIDHYYFSYCCLNEQKEKRKLKLCTYPQKSRSSSSWTTRPVRIVRLSNLYRRLAKHRPTMAWRRQLAHVPVHRTRWWTVLVKRCSADRQRQRRLRQHRRLSWWPRVPSGMMQLPRSCRTDESPCPGKRSIWSVNYRKSIWRSAAWMSIPIWSR